MKKLLIMLIALQIYLMGADDKGVIIGYTTMPFSISGTIDTTISDAFNGGSANGTLSTSDYNTTVSSLQGITFAYHQGILEGSVSYLTGDFTDFMQQYELRLNLKFIDANKFEMALVPDVAFMTYTQALGVLSTAGQFDSGNSTTVVKTGSTLTVENYGVGTGIALRAAYKFNKALKLYASAEYRKNWFTTPGIHYDNGGIIAWLLDMIFPSSSSDTSSTDSNIIDSDALTDKPFDGTTFSSEGLILSVGFAGGF